MRVYVAATPEVVISLLSGEVTFDEYLAPDQFEFDQSVDEEEREHLVSLLAADDALELTSGKIGLVLAADLADEQLNGAAITLRFNQIASLLISEDGEELSWFAPEEILHQIDEWL
ncbi:MAG: hypothetical protein ACKOCL_01755 [Candidatus Nanopelagicaceae bacterium]